MTHKSILSVILALACLTATAQEKVYDYHWLNMGVTEDLATTAVISWGTKADNPKAIAQIAPMSLNPKIADNAKTVEVKTTFLEETTEEESKTYPAEYWHRAYFTGLEPETQYLYRVGDGKHWSEWCEFKTAAKENKPFKFIYFGDVQSRIMDVYPRVARKAFTLAPDAAFVTFVGDLTSSRSYEAFNQFFEANNWMIRQMPVAAVADGHEHVSFTGPKITSLWEHMFAFPANAPEKATYQGMYYFDCQDCRFISVDSFYFRLKGKGIDDEIQEALEWIESVLKDNPCTWTIVAQHQPFYSTGRIGREEISRFSYPLKELYSKYGVDIILSGHDHQYSRFSEKENGKSVTPIEIISQAGGHCYIPTYNSHADRISTGTQNFQIIEVDSKHIVYKAYQPDGTLFDSFIIKNKNGKKKYIDASKGLPEKTDLDYTSSSDKEHEAEMLQKKAAYEAKKK